MKLHVLVTGGAGYLGSILCEHLLDSGYSVSVVDNLMYRQNSLFNLCSNRAFDFVKGDVRDKNLMRRMLKQADVLIPLAAIVGTPACECDPWLAKSVNLDAIRLLNGLRSADQLVIFPTTNSGYGTKSDNIQCTEETPLEPITLYGQTKVQAESELLESPKTIALRLATVFGMSPRMRLDLLVNHFVYSAVTDGYLVIFEKKFKRNYIHIRDIADCFIHCIKNADQMTGKSYNVGLESANFSKEELAFIVKKHIPRLYIHFSEIGKDPDKRNYIVSIQRLKEVGFEAKCSLDAGIKELIKGYRSMGHLPHKNI